MLAAVRACAWPRDEVFGETTCNIGVISGGTAPNVIAAEARADLQIRFGTEAAVVRHALERAIASRAEVEYLTATPAMRLTAVPGFDSCIVAFTTDIPHLSTWGTPLLLGPGSILDAHSPHERIATAELEQGVERYVALARALAAEPRAAAAGPTTAEVRR